MIDEFNWSKCTWYLDSCVIEDWNIEIRCDLIEENDSQDDGKKYRKVKKVEFKDKAKCRLAGKIENES